jgi:hypothetical protein
VEPHVIQQVLGHSSAVTTVDTHWQVFRDLAQAAVNAAAELLRQHASRRRRLSLLSVTEDAGQAVTENADVESRISGGWDRSLSAR